MKSRSTIAAIALAASMILTPTMANAQSSVVEDVTVVDNPQGPVYQVEPTLSGGRIGSSALSSDPSAELEDNGVPATRSIVNQFICHVIFAPIKSTWNLESWRPVVSFSSMINTRCNP